MNPSSSSTSSSEPGAGRGGLSEAVAVAAWFLAFVAVYDVAVGAAMKGPVPEKVRAFFEYGRSLEGKLRRVVGLEGGPPSVIAPVGFLVPPPGGAEPSGRRPGSGLFLAFYGMSFSNDVAEAVDAIDPGVTTRKIAGPQAPANHSYAAFTVDRGRHDADAVVLGVLASSTPGVLTRGLTWYFESPFAYTYPRYVARGGALEASWPVLRSYKEFRDALAETDGGAAWGRFVAQVRADDPFYDPFLFEETRLDASTTVRLVRKALAQRRSRAVRETVHTRHGFDPDSEAVRALRGIVAAFAADARADGKLPVVLLFNERGYSDHLFRTLEPTLSASAIPVVSTHTVCPSTDPRNHRPDGHFTPAANKKIAAELLRVVRSRLPAGGRPLPHDDAGDRRPAG